MSSANRDMAGERDKIVTSNRQKRLSRRNMGVRSTNLWVIVQLILVDTDKRDRGLINIMALLLQLKMKELFVQSVVNPAQGHKDPPEQGLTSKYPDIGASQHMHR